MRLARKSQRDEPTGGIARFIELIQFDDLAVDQRHPAIHAARQLHIVGCDQHCHSGRPDQLHQRLEHVIGSMRIEIAGRLIRKHCPRRVGEAVLVRVVLFGFQPATALQPQLAESAPQGLPL